jgi:hypothetical protein
MADSRDGACERRRNSLAGRRFPVAKLSATEPKPIFEHQREVQGESTVVRRENQSQIRRAAPPCGLIHGIFHVVHLERDDALAASASTAQEALIWPERPGLPVVVLPDQTRVAAAVSRSRTLVVRCAPGETGDDQERKPSVAAPYVDEGTFAQAQ